MSEKSILSILTSMHLIPTYPQETPLELKHLRELQPYLLAHREGISEFSMASLYPFSKKRAYSVSSYRDSKNQQAYIIKGLQWKDQKEEKFAMLPSGYPGKELLEKLFTDVAEINTIGESHLKEWQKGVEESSLNLTLGEDRDNADYIYDKKSLIELVGQSLHKKAAHAQKFASEYPNRVLMPAHLAKVEHMVEILDLWAEGKDVVEDYKATLAAIENQEELSLKGVVLYANDKPVAFTLGEEEGYHRFIVHIEKALGNYKGVYQYINRAFAASLPDRISEINREQDLGIPGLRQAKMTYKPSRFLMKWKIRRSD